MIQILVAVSNSYGSNHYTMNNRYIDTVTKTSEVMFGAVTSVSIL